MNTRIVSINEGDSLDNVLRPCADVIKEGGLVIFPTETVYGLGADATNPEAAKKIYSAKGRPSDNPLIIHIAKPSDAEWYTYTSPLYYKLAEAFMPGPLTVIMRSRESIPRETRGGLDTVAVRCPSSKIANRLIELSGVAIAAPSANLSGSPSPTTAKHSIDDMMGRVDVIIDGGECDFGLESTIVKLEDDESVTILRPGRITVDDIRSLGICVNVAQAVTSELHEGEVALSPGMKYRHYAPKSELILFDCEIARLISYIKGSNQASIAIIAYSECLPLIKRELPDAVIYDFGKMDDLFDQARHLFNVLREADKVDYDVIYAPLPDTEGIGLALYNRMIRAAAHKIIRL